MPDWTEAEIKKAFRAVCPACRQSKWVEAYEPPEIAERRKMLKTELDATRVARREAKRNGTPLPAGLRTPTQIMQDLSALPKVYLLEP
jgi:hypothetical protein